MSSNRDNGNASEMREALEFAENELWSHGLFDASKRIEAALAKPPRNCDVGTVEEQTRRLRENCEKYKPSCKGCKFLTDIQRENCWLKWAQMPYDEGEIQ